MDNNDQIDHAEHEYWRGRCPECDDKGCSHIAPLSDRERVMAGALFSILNVEGAAIHGARLPAFLGLDVPWHFDKVRWALRGVQVTDIL